MKVIRAKRRQRIDGGSLGNGRGGDGETRDWLVIAERGRLILIMVLCTLMVRVAEVEDERFIGILARAKIWFSNETNSARRELGDASRRLRKEESSGEQLVGILWATALSGTTNDRQVQDGGRSNGGFARRSRVARRFGGRMTMIAVAAGGFFFKWHRETTVVCVACRR